jgi:hypothetical protein
MAKHARMKRNCVIAASEAPAQYGRLPAKAKSILREAKALRGVAKHPPPSFGQRRIRVLRLPVIYDLIFAETYKSLLDRVQMCPAGTSHRASSKVRP